MTVCRHCGHTIYRKKPEEMKEKPSAKNPPFDHDNECFWDNCDCNNPFPVGGWILRDGFEQRKIMRLERDEGNNS